MLQPGYQIGTNYDLALEIGFTKDFLFWRTIPEDIQGAENLVFYNTILHPQDAVRACRTIHSITHPELGAVRKIDTTGLHYTIVMMDDYELLVNAEEEPGALFERISDKWERSSRSITNWKFIVEFEFLSELKTCKAETQ